MILGITDEIISFISIQSNIFDPKGLQSRSGPLRSIQDQFWSQISCFFGQKRTRFYPTLPFLVKFLCSKLKISDPKWPSNKVGSSKKGKLTPQVHPRSVLKPNFMICWSKTNSFLPDLNFSSQFSCSNFCPYHSKSDNFRFFKLPMHSPLLFDHFDRWK